MSTNKKIRTEVTTEDLTSITTLREKIDQLIKNETDAKKAAQVLKLLLEKDKLKNR